MLDNNGGIPISVNSIQRGAVNVHGGQNSPTTSLGGTSANGSATRSRPWHDFGRQNDADKIQIPKMYVEDNLSQYMPLQFHSISILRIPYTLTIII